MERSEAGWAVVALNRPDQLNTLSIELRKEFDHALGQLEADPSVHVLILTAHGKAFTAGLDAGYAFASWPLMGDALFPAGVPDYATVESKNTAFVKGVVGQLPKS